MVQQYTAADTVCRLARKTAHKCVC